VIKIDHDHAQRLGLILKSFEHLLEIDPASKAGDTVPVCEYLELPILSFERSDLLFAPPEFRPELFNLSLSERRMLRFFNHGDSFTSMCEMYEDILFIL
jgi:hypothetical protein